jgi:hypothetical protein
MGGAIQGGAAGTPGAAGAAGAPVTGENLCVTKAGGEYLFDYTYGLMGEFAFEMSMSCDIGGYLLPLMPVPGDLTEVTVFVGVLADWFHAAILECPGATTELGTEFVMVPVSENRVMSSVDFETIIDTFAMVVSRHAEYDDGFTEEVSEGVFERLNAYFDSAVTDEGSGLTHAIDPETGLCMPPF